MVETLGEAWSLGWRVHMRCAFGKGPGMKKVRECTFRKELDMDTLIISKGPSFPLSRLAQRLFCPRCRSRSVTVAFEPPSTAGQATNSAVRRYMT
jgi:hypothetical protein